MLGEHSTTEQEEPSEPHRVSLCHPGRPADQASLSLTKICLLLAFVFWSAVITGMSSMRNCFNPHFTTGETEILVGEHSGSPILRWSS